MTLIFELIRVDVSLVNYYLNGSMSGKSFQLWCLCDHDKLAHQLQALVFRWITYYKSTNELTSFYFFYLERFEKVKNTISYGSYDMPIWCGPIICSRFYRKNYVQCQQTCASNNEKANQTIQISLNNSPSFLRPLGGIRFAWTKLRELKRILWNFFVTLNMKWIIIQ